MYIRLFFLSLIIALALSGLPAGGAACPPAADSAAAHPHMPPYTLPPFAYPPGFLPEEPAARPGADDLISIQAMNPTLLWNTFHGAGTSVDEAHAVAIDVAGNVYVAGSSTASWGEPIEPFVSQPGYPDVFVAKLDSAGVLQWNTFMGGEYDDSCHDIVLDQAGNIYIAGESDTEWGEPLNGHVGNLDAFVAKLDNDGNRLWHTFLGSATNDYGYGLDVTVDGAIYLTGSSDNGWGDNIVNPHAELNQYDAFLVKLNSDASVQWNTFMGSADSSDDGNAVMVDSSGTAFVAGMSMLPWGSNPVLPHSGSYDAFVAQFNGSTGDRQLHTFMDGYGGNKSGEGIALNDGAGRIYVAGIDDGSGSNDIWVGEFVTSTLVLQNRSVIGSSGHDSFGGIDVDAEGHVYVSGSSIGWGAPLNPNAGNLDALIAQFDSTLGLEWHTFLGAIWDDYGFGVAVSDSGAIHVVGASYETWGDPVNPFTTGKDAFVAKLGDLVPLSGVRIDGPAVGWTDTLYSFTSSASPVTATTPITYVWQATDQATITHTGSLTDSVSFSWAITGSKDILIAAANVSGTVTNSHSISITSLPVALSSVTIDGPTTGAKDAVYSFTANASPVTATTPITYVWQATNQATVTHTGNLTDSASFSWAAAGSKEVTVAATNVSGTVTDSHTISLTESVVYKSYIPLTQKNPFCDQYEPNDSRPKNGGSPPGPFTSGQTIQAQICSGDPRDLYYADLTAGKTVIFTLTDMPSNVNFDLYLWDENSDIPKAKSEKGAGQDEKITYAVPVTGRYYVDVYPKQGTGAYSLRYH